MTKTVRLNDIAMMIYHGGCPEPKISIREISYNHRTKTFNIQRIRNDVVSWRYHKLDGIMNGQCDRSEISKNAL